VSPDDKAKRTTRLAVALLVALAESAAAEVVRLEVSAREPFAGGTAFGDSGAYEKLRGRRLSDPRPSLESRYPTREGSLRRVEASVEELRREDLLLADDARALLEQARSRAWPLSPP
jgi:hypothetical protein